jgi:UPF0755 protein
VNLPKLKLDRERIPLVILLLTLMCLWVVVVYLFAPKGGTEEKRIVIKPGTSTKIIAKELKREGIINSPLGFQIAVRSEGVGERLKAGSYLLSGNLSVWQIARRLAQGSVDDLAITIPEGYNTRQIASLVEENGLGTKRRFLELVRSPTEQLRALVPELPKGKSLEGFLFPDTYRMGPGDDEEVLIKMMLKRFWQVAPGVLKGSPLSFYDTVILGSIIEKEARLQRERPLISAVFHNRLRKGMRLQSCATVAYILAKNQAKLSYEDLKVDSPYNTYLVSGLPPEPISNPGLASLKAAAHPAAVDYLYFFALGDGSHHFSRTYQEHLDLQKR